MSSLRVLSLALLCVASVCANVNIDQNYENVVVTKGDSVELICTADVKPQFCTFLTPQGVVRNLGKGASYENGRIQYHQNTENDCGITIATVEDGDNGVWKCTITDDKFQNGERSVAVTVGIPPAELLLRVDGAVADGETVDATLDDDATPVKKTVECVATQARPEPEFKWFVGSTELQGEVESLVENESADGKADYVSRLNYYADAKHNGQPLRCEVEHQAYTAAQKTEQQNKIEKVLNVYFKPTFKGKPTIFYNLREDGENHLTLKFEANPAPESGFWHIDGVEQPVAIGTESLDSKFKSSQVEQTELPGEYQVTLTVNPLNKEMSGRSKVNKLVLTNEQGTGEHKFTLEMGDRPVAEPMNSGPVIGIIIIVVIVLLIVGIAVLARSKGMLCFSAKNGEQLTDEKEAAAFDNAEKGEPLNPKAADAAGDNKATPDKRPAEPAKATTENEEKKSNGAHTPV